jgi:hypothetical protein
MVGLLLPALVGFIAIISKLIEHDYSIRGVLIIVGSLVTAVLVSVR